MYHRLGVGYSLFPLESLFQFFFGSIYEDGPFGAGDLSGVFRLQLVTVNKPGRDFRILFKSIQESPAQAVISPAVVADAEDNQFIQDVF
jgi:hypothetical protein